MSMLTFYAALCHKMANSLSLKLSVSVIIKNTKIVGADLQRANDGKREKNINCINAPNIQ